METLPLETIHALAEVPSEVLRELKGLPPKVLQALREVRPEAILALRAEPTTRATENSAGAHTENVCSADELHRAFDHVYALVAAADLNVVGSIGKYRHGEGSKGWINVFSDTGGGGVDQLLNTPVYKAAEAFSVLGNEVRLSILRSLFDAAKSANELLKSLGLGTSGQVYHHLRELERIHAVETRDGRYHFNGAFTRVYLTALLVAAEAVHAGPYGKDQPAEQDGPVD